MTKDKAEEIVDLAFGGLGCCGHYTAAEPLDQLRKRIVRVTRASLSEGGWGPEHSCAFIAQLDDGKWLAVEEAEDTSGHGCQCSGSADIYDSEEEAIRLGIGYWSKDDFVVVEDTGA